MPAFTPTPQQKKLAVDVLIAFKTFWNGPAGNDISNAARLVDAMNNLVNSMGDDPAPPPRLPES